ncbi:MAG: helix-turn-helix transcriptional regulator [Verrucomicrobia bacterium]|nr:helix-turn-helix transcriptional regulator [Verrucomicrobiota bacterium]
MIEIIVRLARAVASRPRLRLLSYLAQHGETAATPWAAALHLPLNTLSRHVSLLSSVGLIQGRRSGARCLYAFVSPYGEQTLSGSMSRWLCELLAKEDCVENHRGLPEVRDGSRKPQLNPLHAAIFEAATAFTDVRRLEILRYLESHANVTVEEVMNDLGMSAHAVGRHMAKLQRRGLVSVQRKDGRSGSFQMASTYKTPIHARMHGIIQATWRKEPSRTSGSPRWSSKPPLTKTPNATRDKMRGKPASFETRGHILQKPAALAKKHQEDRP